MQSLAGRSALAQVGSSAAYFKPSTSRASACCAAPSTATPSSRSAPVTATAQPGAARSVASTSSRCIPEPRTAQGLASARELGRNADSPGVASDSWLLERLPTTGVALAALMGLALLAPGSGHAEEVLSGSALDTFRDFLIYVETLGAAGPIVFVLTVMVFEMVPLFPTTPLSIASGLLFGPLKGALVVLTGMTLAATNAFLISRGVGRKLAEKVIVMEMSDDHGPVAAKLAHVQHVIRSGGFSQQLMAVTLLRLTPIVPFSASNYVLGLTPVQLPAYLAGTVAGMSVWSLVYASLGGASRKVFDSGVPLGTLLADLAEKASGYSTIAIGASVGLGVVAGGVYAARSMSPKQDVLETSASDSDASLSSVDDAEARKVKETVMQHR